MATDYNQVGWFPFIGLLLDTEGNRIGLHSRS